MTDKVHVSMRAFSARFKFRVDGRVNVVRCREIAKRYGVNYISSPRDRRTRADSSLMAEGIIRMYKGYPDGLQSVNHIPKAGRFLLI